jgi:hypothetical protein
MSPHIAGFALADAISAKTDRLNQIGLISSRCPGRSVLLVALAAVNWPRTVRLEGDLGLLAAF